MAVTNIHNGYSLVVSPRRIEEVSEHRPEADFVIEQAQVLIRMDLVAEIAAATQDARPPKSIELKTCQRTVSVNHQPVRRGS